MSGFSLGQAITLDVVALLMEQVDQSAQKPEPREGESVTRYWIRVVQYQAWEKGALDATYHVDNENPYAESS